MFYRHSILKYSVFDKRFCFYCSRFHSSRNQRALWHINKWWIWLYLSQSTWGTWTVLRNIYRPVTRELQGFSRDDGFCSTLLGALRGSNTTSCISLPPFAVRPHVNTGRVYHNGSLLFLPCSTVVKDKLSFWWGLRIGLDAFGWFYVGRDTKFPSRRKKPFFFGWTFLVKMNDSGSSQGKRKKKHAGSVPSECNDFILSTSFFLGLNDWQNGQSAGRDMAFWEGCSLRSEKNHNFTATGLSIDILAIRMRACSS